MGAPRGPVISRPNYSDQYGAPTTPVILRPSYSDGGQSQYPHPSPSICWCDPPSQPLVTSTVPPLPPPPLTTTPLPSPSPCLHLFTSTEFLLETPTSSLPGEECEFIILPADNVCSLSLT